MLDIQEAVFAIGERFELSPDGVNSKWIFAIRVIRAGLSYSYIKNGNAIITHTVALDKDYEVPA